MLLEISAIDKLVMNRHAFSLKPDAASAHHHAEVEKRDSKLHRHTARIEQRNGRLEEGEHGCDHIDPEQLFPERH